VARTLIVPGVRITTAFDVAPPLPPARACSAQWASWTTRRRGVTGVTARPELFQHGPATAFSFPEALRALANGVSAVVISPVSAGRKA
jgi:hypothetical protein